MPQAPLATPSSPDAQTGEAGTASSSSLRWQQAWTRLLPADALLVGEQHDAAEHQQLQQHVVAELAQRGQLGALALEMAEQGRHTQGLPAHASEADVRAALAWRDQAWPWTRYGPVVMTAVRAGVPVLGANLPMARMREAMRDSALDARLSSGALAALQQRIRQGHCNALPAAQILPMTRVQIARDLAMADTLQQARRDRAARQVVVLVGGNGHMHRSLGVPQHLPPDWRVRVLSAQAMPSPQAGADGEGAADADANMNAGMGADVVWPTPALPPKDYCAAFRRAVPHASGAASAATAEPAAQ